MQIAVNIRSKYQIFCLFSDLKFAATAQSNTNLIKSWILELQRNLHWFSTSSITVECNLQITDFLDVTFDLRTDKYYPYRKDNNQLLYINKQSNHPPTIIKQIPSMVRKKISDISCTKECFNKAAPAYNNALKFSGFNENIQFTLTPPLPPTKNES